MALEDLEYSVHISRMDHFDGAFMVSFWTLKDMVYMVIVWQELSSKFSIFV